MEELFQSSEDTSLTGSIADSSCLSLDDLDDKESVDSIQSSIKEEKIYSNDDHFLNTLNELRRQGTSTDIDIVCRNQTFPAHKLVLVAVSPYFDRLLINDEPESVVMDDLNPFIMDDFLTLVYTGSTDLSRLSLPDLKDLLYVGEKFQCPHFQKLVLEYLTQCLTWKNFGFALNIARSAKDSKAEKKILDYMRQNLNEIWNDENFLTLTESQLISVVLENCEQLQNQDLLLKALITWINHSAEVRISILHRFLPKINPKKISKKLAQSLLQNNNPISSIPELIETLTIAKNSENENVGMFSGSSVDYDIKTEGESVAESFMSNVTQANPSLLVIGRDEANRASIMQFHIHEEMWDDIEDTGLSLETKPGLSYYRNNVFIVGGEDLNSCKLNECYVYDIKKKHFNRLADLRIARSQALVFGLEDSIYVTAGIGRFSKNGLSHMEYLEDMYTNSWKNAPSMHTKRNHSATFCVVDKRAYVTGGGNTKCEMFDSRQKLWHSICSIPENEFQDHSPFLVNVNNKVYSFRYYKPSKLLMFNHESNKWLPCNTRGEPPEHVINAVGIGSKVYALDNTLRFHVLDFSNNTTWFSYFKLPKCMAHPVSLACMLGDIYG